MWEYNITFIRPQKKALQWPDPINALNFWMSFFYKNADHAAESLILF
jgi:hypothetical protein